MKSAIRHPLFVISILAMASCFTGCETVKSALYEPVPYDEVAAEQNITLEEAAALGIVRPKSSMAPLIEAATSLIPVPGAAPLTSLVLNGALAIGAVWLGKKKHTADKVATSLIQGIDTFRDVLDQTPQGEKIDASLTATLKEHQNALQVQREIAKLLERYQTPTKQPIDLDT
ncbi:hypothetical protein SH580_17665 [Coraliomargarita algicola]|uniref:Lipoprotein n=1 Tax=Coraliomargarita algicola TaxID=3092156 RepID=A0ABZ0RIF0_9BACT|nr:hypothetical protein [Coraliomargarita sp. J2-16]WPJ95253.1 hypothetical protein SH580_17665 [Coraliomargarita sp. J2-16]